MKKKTYLLAALLTVTFVVSAQTPPPASPPGQAAQGQQPGPGGRGGRGGPGGAANTNEGADFSAKSPILAKSPADEARTFILPAGYRMELVASDPDIVQPTVIEFDGNGRMYVGEMRSYMI